MINLGISQNVDQIAAGRTLESKYLYGHKTLIMPMSRMTVQKATNVQTLPISMISTLLN